MAKIIKLTPDILEDIKKDFENELFKAKLSDGKFSYYKSFGSTARKASVIYTEKAWQKMQMLIREFDKEVAWHGIAYRGDDPAKDEYYITDILVYPQEVTGATVTADQVKYQTWLMDHEDEVFNNIRMQGHSHVNMSTSPSSVDLALYEKILDQLDDTMFYIFLIYNKRGEKTYKIYDMAKNVMFETSDVSVSILDDGTGLNAFLADARSKVQNRPITQVGYPTYNYEYSGRPYRGSASTPSTTPSAPSSSTASKPAQTPSLPQVNGKEDDDSKKKELSVSSKSDKRSSGRRKGKRRDESKKQASIKTALPKYDSYSKYGGYGYCGYDDDEYDSYFGGYR